MDDLKFRLATALQAQFPETALAHQAYVLLAFGGLLLAGAFSINHSSKTWMPPAGLGIAGSGFILSGILLLS